MFVWWCFVRVNCGLLKVAICDLTYPRADQRIEQDYFLEVSLGLKETLGEYSGNFSKLSSAGECTALESLVAKKDTVVRRSLGNV